MVNLDSLGARIRFGLKQSGKSQSELSRYTGVKSSTVSQWCSDKVKALQSDNAYKVAKCLGVSLQWLVTGAGSPDNEDVVALPSDARPAKGYRQFLECEVNCACNDGSYPMFYENLQAVPLIFSDSFFESLGAKADDCKIVCVKDDSMSPTFSRGDRILVDTRQTDIRPNKVYLLSIAGQIKIQRLIPRLNGDVLVKYDNPEYQDDVLVKNEIPFKVIGMVIYRQGRT